MHPHIAEYANISLLLPLVSVIAGLVTLIWSADRFIEGAIALARRYQIPPVVIGLTLVAFGTSAPEIGVSLMAALSGAGSLALGNVLGSNIANIGLILGITALVAAMPIARGALRVELPLLLGVTLLALPLFLDGQLNVTDGLILCVLMGTSFYLLIRYGSASQTLAAEAETVPVMGALRTGFYIVAGLVLLVVSSRMLVWGAVELATAAGVSELIIGLTLVAVGTSLPELSASVASALKGEQGMALGNIIGSNLFNLLLVMAIPALVGGVAVEQLSLYRDYGSMVLLTVMLLAFAWLGPLRHHLSRPEGGVLLALYIGYSLLIALTSGLGA
ncbi:MAG: calcium/sodium antiporter [Oleiphilaceae bacterium]|nr:calcium/sodium antiporter [Oleiphilaceae bacterium]